VKLALLCLPFAGGGAGFYRAWRDLPPGCPDIVPLQLPGREELFLDPPYRDAAAAAEDLGKRAAELLRGYDGYALFGHSLGAVLAFECARVLTGLDDVADPRHLFASGSPGPWTGRTERATGLPDEEFIARVERFAGYRHDALDDPELRELLLPLLRTDVEMHESYEPRTRDPLSVPITALRGDADELVDEDQAGQWRAATAVEFRYVTVPGRHMYLADSPAALLETVARTLAG
jgi:surfactin synthase thioesterase subunit